MLLRSAPLLFAAALAAQAPPAPPSPAAPVIQAPAQPVRAAAKPPAAMATIGAEELMAHATFLASEELGGRLTGSPGQLAAAKYIADHFAKLGLEPLGDAAADGQRGFHQNYGLRRTSLLPQTQLQLGKRELREGFAVLGARPLDVRVEGRLRFVGLGRTRGNSAEVAEADSLEGVVPVVVIKPPRGKIDRQLGVEEKFGMSFGTFGQLGKTAKNLERKGARAVLFVQLDDPFGLSDVLNYLALSPGKDVLQARFQGAEEGMGALAGMLGGGEGAVSLVLSVAASRDLLAELALDPAVVQEFVASGGDLPKAAADVAAVVQVGIAVDAEASAPNVIAVLRGSDPELAKEAVVYSAHMDHVGRRLDGKVFHGADDNASGSAGLLAIATAYAKAAERPKRSIIFCSVSGEELGLWGSQYYADHPNWDPALLIANVNTDMIGRSGPESGRQEVTVTPSHGHAMFSTLVQDAARCGEELGLKFLSGDKYYTRSDHYNFAKKGIPVVFFCNGEHEDYHQVTDTADKLDRQKMQTLARLAFWTGWQCANAAERPRKLGKQPDWK